MTNPVTSLGLTSQHLNQLAQAHVPVDFVALEKSIYQSIPLRKRDREGGRTYKQV